MNEQPPGNREQPTNTATDRAPTNPDQPPNHSGSSPSQGGGADAEGRCRTFCSSVAGKDCMGAGKLTAAIRAACQAGCVLSAQDQLCASEIAGAIGCLSSLAGLCTAAFDEEQDDACDAAFKAVDDCEEANAPGACNTAGGCECETACQTCTCRAGTDIQALTACGTGACAP